MAVSPQEVEKPTKCAVIVSKKGITAPMRNKLRRRAYEAIGTLLPFVSNGYLCVCSIRKGFCGEIPYGTFIEEIRMLFKKADILNDL
ncbi:MAG: ribonuclease P protein component [Candidatus Yonathbacteria bacterium]|nr:ribonuclease P protein component [Candidatus Yonathbacteria bacterium]